jgi:hypothetical protein
MTKTILGQLTFFPCSFAVLNKYRLASVKPVRALFIFASIGGNSSKYDSNFPSPIKKYAKHSKNQKINIFSLPLPFTAPSVCAMALDVKPVIYHS